MAHNPHDQFAKQFLEELLSPFGQVILSQEVLGEPRWVDLWFQPHAPAQGGDRPALDLGLLGTLTQAPCLLEPYRNAPDFRDLRSCLSKRFALVADQERQTPSLREADLPHLWILVPTFSEAARRHCGAVPDPQLVPGCYTLPPLLGTHLILLHQLPPTPDTLWLRLLGKGRCQREAIREVLALPNTANYRDLALQLLANWKIAIDTLKPTPSEEEETLMALSQAYLEWEQKTLRLGAEQGEVRGQQRGERQERRRLVLEMLELELEFKFGEEGRSLLPYLQQVADSEVLYGFLRSSKPLTQWADLQGCWFDRLEQAVPPQNSSQNSSPEDPSPTDPDLENSGPAIDPAALAVALKLRFPTASPGAIAQAQTQLLRGSAPDLGWSDLGQRIRAATAIEALQ